MMGTPPPPKPAIRRNVWVRSFGLEPSAAKRLVALVVGAVVVLTGSFVAGICALLRNADATKTAVAVAETSVGLKAITGMPLRVGWFVQGSINLEGGGGGHATLRIPVIGPAGKGHLQVEEDRVDGRWVPEVILFEEDGTPLEKSILIVGNMWRQARRHAESFTMRGTTLPLLRCEAEGDGRLIRTAVRRLRGWRGRA